MKAKALALAALMTVSAPAVAEPTVVASILPLHSLVANVMESVGTPVLLLKGAGSPHAYALKPSDAQALSDADRVFWVGPALEGFMEKLVEGLPPGTAIALAGRASITLLPQREGGVWKTPDNEDQTDHAQHGHRHGTAHVDDEGAHNPHIWLDPQNAARLVDVMVEELAVADPDNERTYRANGKAVTARLNALDRELRAKLEPVRNVPYVVFHDAYYYFEARYGMSPAGSISVNAERAPGVRRLYEIRGKILEADARCVFSEPQFEPRVVKTVIEGTSARSATLDPLGATLEPSADAYFTLLRRLAASLVTCLTRVGE
jgi:zinc transport system substrate-binding protein